MAKGRGKTSRLGIGRHALVAKSGVSHTKSFYGGKKTKANKVIGNPTGGKKATLSGQPIANTPGTNPRNYRNPRPIGNTRGAKRAGGQPGY